MIRSVYIHIPFCKNICSYCDFCKNYYNEDLINKYLDSLEKDIKEKYKGENIETIYIGGGTPSSLSLKLLDKLFKIIKIFNLNNNYEFTFECNYTDINKDFLKKIKANKVNRISIGIQSFNNKFEYILERKINKEDINNKISLVKKYFNNINVDLMYAIPTEDINDLENDINNFLDLDINHISTYCLIKEDHTKLYINDIKELDSDIQNKMYYLIIDKLTKNGFKQYELSNFCKDNSYSKHNLVYWNNDNYYGFGLGASGFINNVRYDNTRNLLNYIKGNYIIYKEELNNIDLIKDEVMLNLRKINGINKKEFYNKYNLNVKDIFNIDDLIEDKYIVEDNDNIYINKDYLFVSNEIIIKFLDSYNLN